MIKGSIQEDITIVNIYAPNIGTPQYIRQMLTAIKGKKTYNQDYSTQQGSHSDLTEKLKPLQTSKS